MIPTYKNIAVCILLTIVTCGIYGICWMIALNDDINMVTGRQGPSGGVAFLLSVVTCGIYGFYWMYQMGVAVEQVHAANNVPDQNAPLVYLLLDIFGLGIVSYALMQNELNKFTPGA